MNRRTFLARTAGFAVLSSADALRPRSVAAADEAKPADLGELLTPIRAKHALPGLAGAVVREGGRVVARGVAGVRESGKEERITPDDRFMIGSCTKRMTGLMVCRLVDAGRLSFDMTLREALPDTPMREEYRPVTIAQLLNFTGGLPAYTRVDPQLTPVLFEMKGTPAEQQARFVRHVLQEAPAAKPGAERLYSNASYALLAYIAAGRAGKTWEAIMEEQVFGPLGMRASGFGRPRSKERPDQPSQHVKRPDGRYVPRPEDQPDPLIALPGPGGVHCTVGDFATWAAYELAAAAGKDPLLKPETSRRWQEVLPRRGGSPVFGGNPSLTAAYVLWPLKKAAAVVATNAGGASDACKEVLDAARDRYAG